MKSDFRATLLLRPRAARAGRVLALLCALALGLPAVVHSALRDPTRPYGAGGRSAAPASGLQSTIIGPGGSRAVIDGRVYREGERYRGAIVKEIRPYEVILSESGKLRRLRLVPALKRDAANDREAR